MTIKKTVKYFVQTEAIMRPDLSMSNDISNRIRSNASETAVISAANSYVNYENQNRSRFAYKLKLTKIWREITNTEIINCNF